MKMMRLEMYSTKLHDQDEFDYCDKFGTAIYFLNPDDVKIMFKCIKVNEDGEESDDPEFHISIHTKQGDILVAKKFEFVDIDNCNQILS